jgi:hypothetical protein
MKEWHRTIMLVLLLAVAIGFIVWSKQASLSSLIQGV